MAETASEMLQALRRGAEEAWRSRRLAIGLWLVGALGGLVSAAAWSGGWAEALRQRTAGFDLGRGFDLLVLEDLLRSAGPSLGQLSGWGWSAGLLFLLLIAVLQGGALHLLVLPGPERNLRRFTEACGAHASAMTALAVLSLAAAGLLGGLAVAMWEMADAVGQDRIGSPLAALMRVAAVIVPAFLFVLTQVVLELARIDRVATRDAGGLLPLAMASRFVAHRPLRCLGVYVAAAVATLLLALPGLALARGGGALEHGWAWAVWAGLQLVVLGRWVCRVGLWAALGMLYGVVPRQAP
jgi:hypothetical protein